MVYNLYQQVETEKYPENDKLMKNLKVQVIYKLIDKLIKNSNTNTTVICSESNPQT